MNDEKRKGDKPIPDDIKNYLNDAQLSQLHTIENFGWEIKYIRRPLFQEHIVVVTSAEGDSIGVLEEDGRLNLEPDIDTRQ